MAITIIANDATGHDRATGVAKPCKAHGATAAVACAALGFVLALLPAPALAGGHDCRTVNQVASVTRATPSSELTAGLSLWIARKLGTAPVTAPDIMLVPVADMPCLARTLGRSVKASAVSMYLDNLQIVVLPDNWQETSIRDQSALLHELVHHAQLMAGRIFACQQAAEEEAYRLQSNWLEAHDDSLEAAFQIDPFTYLALTNCGM